MLRPSIPVNVHVTHPCFNVKWSVPELGTEAVKLTAQRLPTLHVIFGNEPVIIASHLTAANNFPSYISSHLKEVPEMCGRLSRLTSEGNPGVKGA
jgi:hypothetical protein